MGTPLMVRNCRAAVFIRSQLSLLLTKGGAKGGHPYSHETDTTKLSGGAAVHGACPIQAAAHRRRRDLASPRSQGRGPRGRPAVPGQPAVYLRRAPAGA